MYELEATNDSFHSCNQGKNRATIYGHRATIWQNWATISGTLHLGCNLMRKSYSDLQHRSTILAFLSFLIKAKLFFEPGVGLSERRISIFWSCTSETKVGDHQELITGLPIHVMNPSYTLVIYALAMSR